VRQDKKLRIAIYRLTRFTGELQRLASWRDSLERRLELADELLNDGLPDPHFGYLEAEVVEFTVACEKLKNRLCKRSGAAVG